MSGILGFVAFLGVDALIERTGRLQRIERTLNELSPYIAGSIPAERVLRTRAAFEWMDLLVAHARRSVLTAFFALGAVAQAGPDSWARLGITGITQRKHIEETVLLLDAAADWCWRRAAPHDA
ncbi:hypothetical protein [Catenulispora rubra]|uniref:hypothetical protein n=1 Tax=Catenulispora rubra TaxID=280293 RepID=UPI0018922A30|nr:hypothetical protein [Catenulispora rubra]